MNRLIIIFIPIISLLILLYGVNLPFAGQHDWNSAVYGNIARNHVRYGLAVTKLGMVTNAGYAPQDKFVYFTHYPPLMPLLIALSFTIFGVTEWAARLVPILSAVVMIYFLFKLSAELEGTRAGLLTAILATFSPMLLYYSKIPVHETVVLGFIAMTVWFYAQWLKFPTSKNYYFTLLGLIASQLTSWAGYYLSLYLPLHALLFLSPSQKPSKVKLFILGSVAPIMFLLHWLHMSWVATPGELDSIWEALRFRLNLGPQATVYQITWSKFLTTQASWIVRYFTRIMTVLSLIWLLTFVAERFKRLPVTLRDSFILLFLVFGLTHNLIFRNLAYIHDYMLIYALPFFALSSGTVLARVYRRLKQITAYAGLFILFILFLIATERQAFLKTLFHSGDGNPGVSLGQTLAAQTDFTDTIVILSPKFMQFYEVFVRFYADRHIYGADSLTPEILTAADYVVIPKTDAYALPQDKQYLLKNYSQFESDAGIIFDLNSKP